MAKTVVINSVVYQGAPAIQVPLSGEAGNATFYETSDADSSASDILAGKTAYGANGKIQGTLTVATVSQDATSKVLTIS